MLRRARPSGWGCCEPRPMSRGYLLVRVDGKPYGLPLGRVLEVGDLGEVFDVPRALAAVRGVTPLRGRLVPLIHLGALLGERTPPADRGRTAVLVELGAGGGVRQVDRKSTRLNSSHTVISYAVFCLKKKKQS